MRIALLLAAVAIVPSGCGGSGPPPPAPPTAAGTLGAAPVSPDASLGPPSTTTQTVGGATGTRLTPLGGGDAGGDGGKKQHGELGRTVADIRAIINARRDEARACYDNALGAHPGIEGNLDVRWTIDPTGKVTEAELDTSKSEIIEPAVANCVIAIIKKIQFNPSAMGYETKAHYPFNFHPHAVHKVMGN